VKLLTDRQTDKHRVKHNLFDELNITARSSDGSNVQKIPINVGKRVYYEKNNKRQLTLIMNVDIFSNSL